VCKEGLFSGERVGGGKGRRELAQTRVGSWRADVHGGADMKRGRERSMIRRSSRGKRKGLKSHEKKKKEGKRWKLSYVSWEKKKKEVSLSSEGEMCHLRGKGDRGIG